MSQNRRDKLRISLSTRSVIYWYSALSGFGVAILVALVLYLLAAQERASINQITLATARGIDGLLKKDIKGRISALTALGQQWTLSEGLPRADWDAATRNMYDSQPGYRSIGWLDSSLDVRWVTPREDHQINLRSNPTLLAAQTARDSRNVVLATPHESTHGGKGLGIYVPIYHLDTEGGHFDGVMASVLLFAPLLDGLLPTGLTAKHELSISVNGQTIYSSLTGSQTADQQWSKQQQFDMYNASWLVDVVPTDDFVSLIHSQSPNILVIIIGALLSGLMALTVYVAMTARNQAQQIRINKQITEHLFRNLPGIAYRAYDQEYWPMEFVSEGCHLLTGFSKSEFERQEILWGKLIHPEDYAYVKQSVQQAISKNKIFEIEYRILIKDNSVRWVWERGEAFLSEPDNSVRLEGFITDITKSKLSEIALVESRAFSEAVVDSVVEAVITIDNKGVIGGFNRAAENMFGYSFDEVKGKNVYMLMSEPYADNHDNCLASYLEASDPGIIDAGRGVNAKRKDGVIFPIHFSMNKIKNDLGVQFVGLIRDLSQQRAAEDETRKHIEQLAHADRLNMLGEMVAGIAHEINQPLTAISLFSQAGKRLFDRGDVLKLPETFDKLSEHAQRAGAVIERIQMMAKAGDRVKESINCNALIKEIVKLAEAEARMLNIAIHLETGAYSPSVFVDRVQIQQVVLNLLRNGMDAMVASGLSDGNTISLQTQLSEAKSEIEIRVIDSGCGVSKQTEEILFTPFVSTKKNGMGMGLSISKAIVAEHGGRLQFYKNEVAGVTFFFTLPIEKNSENND